MGCDFIMYLDAWLSDSFYANFFLVLLAALQAGRQGFHGNDFNCARDSHFGCCHAYGRYTRWVKTLTDGVLTAVQDGDEIHITVMLAGG